MATDDAGGTNRRELLRNTTLAGAAGVTGFAAATGSATAATFERGDVVEVTGYDVPTLTGCCDFSANCPGAERENGDTGEVVGTCQRGGNRNYVYVRVYWHTLRGNRSVTYVDDWDVQHAD